MWNISLTEGGWFEGMPPSQSQMVQTLLDGGKTEEEVAELWLSGAGSRSTAGFGTTGFIQNFYVNVKEEFIAFV